MSLNLRIILSATLVLAIFVTLTAAALDRAFIESTETALRDKLTSQVYVLMAAAEINDAEIIMPSNELDALLGLPSSGVYAQIINQDKTILWQSLSILNAKLPQPDVLDSGEKRFLKTSVNDKEFYVFSYGVNWGTDNASLPLTFNITTDLASFNNQISEYRGTLWSWLLGMAMLLLLSQTMILRWGLLPLRKVGKELLQIESGKQQQIEDSYPREIDQLTMNINVLLNQEQQQKTRYRNALGDLAHSLKTPLAVLQSGLNVNHEQQDDAMQEQITRMNAIVEYQLQRAATAGSAALGNVVNLYTLIERLLSSLNKVYREKSLSIKINVDEALNFKADEGDLMELLGNLLDNAFKWANQAIEIEARQKDKRVVIRIMDDGPGIAPNEVTKLLQRGIRADQTMAGHGIGLSIVCNIVDAYNGELSICQSPLKGCEVEIIL